MITNQNVGFIYSKSKFDLEDELIHIHSTIGTAEKLDRTKHNIFLIFIFGNNTIQKSFYVTKKK